MKSAASKKKDDDYGEEVNSLEVEQDRAEEMQVTKVPSRQQSALAVSDDPLYFDIK